LTLEECFERRQLRSTSPDLLKSAKSVATAEEKLNEAEQLSRAGFRKAAIVMAYAAMFHAGRALLFKDGIVEKSHYCLVQYLNEKYVKTGKLENRLITIMDSFREERHDVMYGLERLTVKEGEEKTAIENAKELIEVVKKLLRS
jgi:uncharacterized protein (UPF0332 family)